MQRIKNYMHTTTLTTAILSNSMIKIHIGQYRKTLSNPHKPFKVPERIVDKKYIQMEIPYLQNRIFYTFVPEL